jgi:hypothetical protein
LGFEIGAAVAMERCTSADKSAEYIRIKLLGLKIIKENLAPPKFNDRPEWSSKHKCQNLSRISLHQTGFNLTVISQNQ